MHNKAIETKQALDVVDDVLEDVDPALQDPKTHTWVPT